MTSLSSSSTVAFDKKRTVEVVPSTSSAVQQGGSGPPTVNINRFKTSILYVRNLPYDMKVEEVVKIFQQYGTVVQLRMGDEKGLTMGTAFVVYSTPQSAKKAMHTLKGFKVQDRYLVISPYDPKRMKSKLEQQLQDNKKASKHSSTGNKRKRQQ